MDRERERDEKNRWIEKEREREMMMIDFKREEEVEKKVAEKTHAYRNKYYISNLTSFIHLI